LAFVALLDANVLYPAYLRDALLRLAEAEIYQVRWSRKILDEMARNVLENNPNLSEERIERLVRTMERAFPEAMVTGQAEGRNLPAPRAALPRRRCSSAKLCVTGRRPSIKDGLRPSSRICPKRGGTRAALRPREPAPRLRSLSKIGTKETPYRRIHCIRVGGYHP
jgi:hypothetical protein